VAYGLQQQPNLDDRVKSLLGRLLGLVLLALAGAAAYLLFSAEETKIEPLTPLPRALGLASPFRFRLSNEQGVRRVRAWIEQNSSKYDVYDHQYPGTWREWISKGQKPVEVSFVAGKDRALGLVAGRAKLVVQAEANNLRGRESRLSHEVPVVLGRPEIHVEPEPVFLRRGGTGIVGFRARGDWSEAGVKVGKYQFPSYSAKGDPNYRIVLFAYPPDVDMETPPVAYAKNLAGDETTAIFRHYVTKIQFREREVKIGDPFLNRVVSRVDPSSSGELWQRFAKINSEMRRANDKFLSELSAKGSPMRLWKGAFQLLPKATNEARFADHRTYLYQGRELNREWHLGVDLASVKNAPLPAANDGVVLFAGMLGIYGNCVVIDHGMGIQTIYGHLAKIDAREGDKVTRGQIIGNTGMTGLAGGDHAHIGLQLHGVFVDPVEWSLPKWIDKTLMPLVSQIEPK
jgi:murein DD-endopeptidase MepM/ murein hydrolase activator NlpD